jgi:enoyl-CoA hydratase/carnithine racemase
MDGREVLVETGVSGDVWITINRPQKHNALARKVLAELADVIAEVSSDQSTRCVVLRGAGEKYFAAGGDLVDLAMVRTEEATCVMADAATAALDAVRNCPVPAIAYVNGDALGGGAELAVACDMRMLEAHARIGFVQGRMGITSAWGGGPDLCQLVGAGRAMRMMSRCEMIDAKMIDAKTALDWGLIDVVVTGGAESADVQAFLKPLFDRSPLVLRSIKEQALAWRQGLSYGARREIERKNLVATWLSTEHRVAVDRFLAKEKT